jgi:membrane protease YdiL (CAAX protease family)
VLDSLDPPEQALPARVSEGDLAAAGTPGAGSRAGPTPTDRAISFTEVVLCSGLPSQILIALTLQAVGWSPVTASGALSLRYVAVISLLDTLIIVSLVRMFLAARGERPAGVLFAGGRPLREVLAGAAAVPAIVLGTGALGLALRHAFPWLHNVPDNPLAALLRTPRDIAVFSGVVVLAGGVREEVQRAFVLHRFRQHLGGAPLGLVLFSLAFGLGHAVQGYDAAILTALLGCTWGWMYLRRGSILAPMTSHALFNLLEVAREVLVR